MINIIRNIFNTDSTVGELYLNGIRFCYTLEDAIRPYGVKIQDYTAIPEGVYFGRITYSPKYKREMILIYNNQENRTIDYKGVKFEGVRVHGGNKASDSSGCVLVAFNRIDNETIQGTAEKQLTAKIKELYGNNEFKIIISNETI